jgi:F-type H+-transporting ATPase subunit c
MGIASFGGALGQAKTAAAALEGIARNPQAAPKVQTPMIIALAMTESLVLFAFVIAFFLQGKF